MKRSSLLFVFLVFLALDSFAATVQFNVATMTGDTNDVTINVRAVNNPVIYNGQFYYLPAYGTNLTTTNGFGQINLIPGNYSAAIVGQSRSWNLNVTNGNTVEYATDISHDVTVYSGIYQLTGSGGLVITQPTPGVYNLDASAVSGGGSGNTNGLASIPFVQAATNGFTDKSVTNGLATTSFVNAAVAAGTSGLASVALLQASTNGFTDKSVTNGLATVVFVQSATNGFVDKNITNGLMPVSYLNAALVNYTATTNLVPAAKAAEYGTVPRSLVDWYTFGSWSNQTVFADDTFGSNATLTGGATLTAAGILGNGLSFDGSGLVTIPASALNSGLSNATISVWLDPVNPGSGGQYFLGKFKQTGVTEFQYKIFTNQVQDYQAFAPVQTAAVNNPCDGSWHLFTMTISPAAGDTLYWDGVAVTNSSWGAPTNCASTPITLGGIGSAQFIGSLDDVRVYKRALSASEVAALYQQRYGENGISVAAGFVATGSGFSGDGSALTNLQSANVTGIVPLQNGYVPATNLSPVQAFRWLQFTNAIDGATNGNPPANASTIRAWVNFTNISGGVFKMPLYQ